MLEIYWGKCLENHCVYYSLSSNLQSQFEALQLTKFYIVLEIWPKRSLLALLLNCNTYLNFVNCKKQFFVILEIGFQVDWGSGWCASYSRWVASIFQRCRGCGFCGLFNGIWPIVWYRERTSIYVKLYERIVVSF